MAGCHQPIFLVRSTLGPESQDIMTEDVVRHHVSGAQRARGEWPWDEAAGLKPRGADPDAICACLRDLAAQARLPRTLARLREVDGQVATSTTDPRLAASLRVMIEERLEALEAMEEIRRRGPPEIPAFRWRHLDAIRLLTAANNGVDCLALEIEGPVVAQVLYPDARRQKECYRRLIARIPAGMKPFNTAGSDGFHFDDLFTFDDIVRRWQDIEAWARFQAIECQANWGEGGRDDYICAIGIMCHATQDFYQHSNWIDIMRRLHDSGDDWDYPLWSDIMPADGLTEDDMARCEAIRLMGQVCNVPSRWPARRDILAKMKESNIRLSTEKLRGGLQTGAWNRKRAIDPETGRELKPWFHTHDALFSRTRRLVGLLAARQTGRTIVTMVGYLDEPYRKDFIEYVSKRDR